MATTLKQNLREVEDAAPKFDMPSEIHARFARGALDGETLGLTLFKLEPNFRIPFGHKHEEQEEVYVVVKGSGRVKVDDEVVELSRGTRSGSRRTRCATSRRGRTASSTWRSAPARIRRTPRRCRTGGRLKR